jgi:hypothetical protein
MEIRKRLKEKAFHDALNECLSGIREDLNGYSSRKKPFVYVFSINFAS